MADNTPPEDQQNADQNNTPNEDQSVETQQDDNAPQDTATDTDSQEDDSQSAESDDAEDDDADDADGGDQQTETPPSADDQDGDGDDDAEDEETRKAKAQAEYKEREARRKQVQAQDNALKSTFEDWVDEAGDDEARRTVRELKAERFLTKVERAQHTLAAEQQAAVKKFDIFNPESKSYDPEAYAEALDDFGPYLETDELIDPQSGEKVTVVLGAKKSLYQHLQQRAQRLERYRQTAQQKGEKQGQRNAQKERMRSEPQFSTAGGARAKDTRKDSELSADEYAKKHNLPTVRA